MIKDSAPPPLEEAETCAADSVDKTPFNLSSGSFLLIFGYFL